MIEAKAHSVMRPVGDDWVVVMTWPAGVEDGGPAELTIRPVEGYPVGGLSSTVLRLIDFKDAIEQLRHQVRMDARRNRAREREQQAVAEWRAKRLQSTLAGGAGEDEYLVLLSSEYLRAVQRGQTKVNEFLAEMAGNLPVSTIRGHLWQARKRGHISASPGKKGGELSDDAKVILERIEADSADSYLAALESAQRRPKRTPQG
ncbi:hypothetical protein ACXPWS_09135 [Mycobacterium sp. BMJ-28]